MTEFNLSEERVVFYNTIKMINGKLKNPVAYPEEKVKEFIRLLKEDIKKQTKTPYAEKVYCEIIDALAGEKLIK